MMARTHRLVSGSTAFVATTAVGVPIGVCGVAAGVATLAASWPDDAEGLLNAPQHRFRPRRLFKHFPVVSHRHLTHYPSLQVAFFAVVAAAIISFAAAPVDSLEVIAGAAAFGCVMHSVADSMTVEQHGIALLWPFSRRGVHLMPRPLRVWVGAKSRSEWVFVACWCAFVLCYLYVRYRHSIPALSKHA
jgi:membrane-bound metal-dependent hydrolase YbcI (DUF457 family)